MDQAKFQAERIIKCRTDFEGVRFYGDYKSQDFSGLNLSYAKFEKGDYRGSEFYCTNLYEAIFVGADLSNVVFSGAILKEATWTGAKLNKGTYFGLLVPYIKGINTRILEQVTKVPESFNMGAWHGLETCKTLDYCGTTHCWAGWAVNLCGARGRMLESFVGSATAGMLILAASMRQIGITDFVCPGFFMVEEDAIDSMKEYSAQEKKAMGLT